METKQATYRIGEMAKLLEALTERRGFKSPAAMLRHLIADAAKKHCPKALKDVEREHGVSWTWGAE